MTDQARPRPESAVSSAASGTDDPFRHRMVPLDGSQGPYDEPSDPPVSSAAKARDPLDWHGGESHWPGMRLVLGEQTYRGYAIEHVEDDAGRSWWIANLEWAAPTLRDAKAHINAFEAVDG